MTSSFFSLLLRGCVSVVLADQMAQLFSIMPHQMELSRESPVADEIKFLDMNSGFL